MIISNHQVSEADRCALSTDAAAASQAALPAVNSSSNVFTSRPSRQRRPFDSPPGDVTGYDVTGHVVLSSTRVVQKLAATLSALTVDCRQSGARNHGNGVEVTSDRYSGSGIIPRTSDTGNTAADTEEPETDLSNDPTQPIDISQNVMTSEQHDNSEVEGLVDLESSITRQQRTGDRRSSGNGDVTTTTMEVILDKGPLGLGFCIDGGHDAPDGPAPISVKRLFKGRQRTETSPVLLVVITALALIVVNVKGKGLGTCYGPGAAYETRTAALYNLGSGS